MVHAEILSLLDRLRECFRDREDIRPTPDLGGII